MTILESPIQIRYYEPATDFQRYIIPNVSKTPWISSSTISLRYIIVNGIYGHENFNQEDFYDDSNLNIRLLPTYKISIYYNDNWFHYEPTDPGEKFIECYNFIMACYEHYRTIKTIDELD